MIDEAPPLRRTEIRPASARTELLAVVRLSMVILVGAWMYVAVDSAKGHEATMGKHLLPFQTLIRDRPSTEQRMFRELQEGLLEAEARRSAEGA